MGGWIWGNHPSAARRTLRRIGRRAAPAGMANVLQAVVTLQVNFVANRHLTWRRRIAGSGVGIWTRWRRFQLARGAGLLLSVAAFPHVAPWTGPSTAYWCNPRRQALGQAPTTRTTVHGLGALLWIKRPGESDGICGGERTYPFSPTQARRLIANSPHVPESYRRLAAAAKSP